MTLDDYVALREPCCKTLLDNGVKGTLLLAEEGSTAPSPVAAESIDALFAWLRSDPRLADSSTRNPTATNSRSTAQGQLRRKSSHRRAGSIRTSRSASMSRRRTGMTRSAIRKSCDRYPQTTRVGDRHLRGRGRSKTVVPRVPRDIKAHYDPSRHKKVAMSARRHPLREVFSYMLARFRGGLPPQGRASSSTSKRCRRKQRDCGAATASYSTTA